MRIIIVKPGMDITWTEEYKDVETTISQYFGVGETPKVYYDSIPGLHKKGVSYEFIGTESAYDEKRAPNRIQYSRDGDILGIMYGTVLIVKYYHRIPVSFDIGECIVLRNNLQENKRDPWEGVRRELVRRYG